jgi:hypothetical protein
MTQTDGGMEAARRVNESVTAQAVILGVAGCLRASLEPKLSTDVAPGLYRIFLRRSDYEALKAQFPTIVEEANRALDYELENFNRAFGEAQPRRFLIHLGRKKARKAYLKPYTGWVIRFDVDDHLAEGEPYRIEASSYEWTDSNPPGDESVVATGAGEPTSSDIADQAAFGVETPTASVSTEASAIYGGEPSSLNPPAVTLPSDATVKTLEAQPGTRTAGRVYAEISFTDDRGSQVYYMRKAQIVVGRGGREYWVDLKLQTAPDVSHEHLRIRYDGTTAQFQLKDLSTYGTTINGVPAASSMGNQNGVRRDIDLWVELPAEAQVGLAGKLFLNFKALEFEKVVNP